MFEVNIDCGNKIYREIYNYTLLDFQVSNLKISNDIKFSWSLKNIYEHTFFEGKFGKFYYKNL